MGWFSKKKDSAEIPVELNVQFCNKKPIEFIDKESGEKVLLYISGMANPQMPKNGRFKSEMEASLAVADVASKILIEMYSAESGKRSIKELNDLSWDVCPAIGEALVQIGFEPCHVILTDCSIEKV